MKRNRRKIIGATVGSPLPKPNLMQNDPAKGDYVKGKEEFVEQLNAGGVSQEEIDTAVNAALAQAKASGEFDGEPGKDGKDGSDGKDGQDGKPGADGKDGAPGKTPVRGEDYWTAEDKTEIVEDVLAQLPDSPSEPGGSVGSAVLYEPQELTEEQQEQARENIGAAGAAHVDAILEDVPLVNILPPDYVKGYWDTASNALISASTHSNTVNPIPVDGGKLLYVTWADSVEEITGKMFCVVYFDENGEKVGNQSAYFGADKGSGERIYITVPQKATQMHLWANDYAKGLRLEHLCVSYSSTTPYVPYEAPGRKAIRTSALNESARLILSPLYGKTIVNFGDSIYGKRRPPNDISTELAKLTGATVYNCGFGGCQMQLHWSEAYAPFSMCSLADAVATGDWTAQDAAVANMSTNGIPDYFPETLEILKGLDFSNVDVVTIAYGTNDFAGGTDLDRESTPTGTNHFAGALRYSIETLLTAYPHLKIYICSQTYRFWNENGVFSDSDTYLVGDKKLTDYVAKTKEVAEEYHLPYIDCYYSLGFNKFNRGMYFSEADGTHPNTQGCHLIAKHVAGALEAGGNPAGGAVGCECADDIGNASVQSDWDQNDQSKPGYIKNRTHWTEQLLEPIVWNCNQTQTADIIDLTPLGQNVYYKISDTIPTREQMEQYNITGLYRTGAVRCDIGEVYYDEEYSQFTGFDTYTWCLSTVASTEEIVYGKIVAVPYSGEFYGIPIPSAGLYACTIENTDFEMTAEITQRIPDKYVSTNYMIPSMFLYDVHGRENAIVSLDGEERVYQISDTHRQMWARSNSCYIFIGVNGTTGEGCRVFVTKCISDVGFGDFIYDSGALKMARLFVKVYENRIFLSAIRLN